jgi:hypothetical protein
LYPSHTALWQGNGIEQRNSVWSTMHSDGVVMAR